MTDRPPLHTPTARRVLIPDVPVVVADWTTAAVLDSGGEITVQPAAKLGQRMASARPIVCHRPAVAARLKVERLAAFDVLELFAFVRPATFCLPTVAGLTEALGLPHPATLEDRPPALRDVVKTLLGELTRYHDIEVKPLAEIASAMARGGWPWGASVLAALGGDPHVATGYGPAAGGCACPNGKNVRRRRRPAVIRFRPTTSKSASNACWAPAPKPGPHSAPIRAQ
jgi:ATP-dependent DNA helicase DinG